MTENNEQKSLDVMENFLNWTPLITSYNFGEDSVSLLNANDNTTKNVVLQYKYKIHYLGHPIPNYNANNHFHSHLYSKNDILD